VVWDTSNKSEVKEKIYSVYKAYLRGADVDKEHIEKYFELDKHDLDGLVDEVVKGRLKQHDAIARVELLASSRCTQYRIKEKYPRLEIVKKKRKTRKRTIRIPYSRAAYEMPYPWYSTILMYFPEEVVYLACEMLEIDPFVIYKEDLPIILRKIKELGGKPKPDMPKKYYETLRRLGVDFQA